jgi:DUF1680 family protein
MMAHGITCATNPPPAKGRAIMSTMNRRNFVRSAALAPLAAAALLPQPAHSREPDQPGSVPEAAPGGTPIHDRYQVTLNRVLGGGLPAYSEEFVLEDVRPSPGRRFTEYSGDVSGRYIGALATAARVYGVSFPGLDSLGLDRLVRKVIALQKPDGYFGNAFHYDKPTDLDLALLWGNGRLLVGLTEYYRLKPSPEVLAAANGIGNFLVRIAPLMLSTEIRDQFGAQHFASSYICWTQQTEGLANLYELTRDVRYSKLALEIFNVTERRPSDHVHGYLSSLRGAMDLYRITNDPASNQASNQASNPAILAKCEADWASITQSNDSLITGGVPEGWSPNNHRTEGCGEADWLRFNIQLWKATGNPKYLAMAERSIFNEMAFNQYESGDFGHRVYTETGLPAAGAVRAWWCCTLHGLRAFPDIQSAAFGSRDGSITYDLPVDGRIASPTLSAEAASSLAQDGKVRIRITSSGKSTLSIRKPEWAEAIAIYINNTPASHPIESGYAVMDRDWEAGDEVTIHYNMSLRAEPTEVNGTSRTVYWLGPWLLGAPASENPAYFNELTVENKLIPHKQTTEIQMAEIAKSPAHPSYAVPIAAQQFRYIPAEFPAFPSTVTLRALAEQGGQPTTSWEIRFLTQPQA